MSKATEKSILVIGGSSGIGLKVSELCADAGMSVHIVGRNMDRLLEAKRILETKTSVEISQFDAHDHDEISNFFNTSKSFNHLVSMVGDVMGGGFISADIETVRHVVESKFFTNLAIAKAAFPKINTGGSMVFTAGTGGRAQHACGSYIGNIAINALVEGLAAELAPTIRVNSVCPTWTLTPFWRSVPQEQVLATKNAFFGKNTYEAYC